MDGTESGREAAGGTGSQALDGKSREGQARSCLTFPVLSSKIKKRLPPYCRAQRHHFCPGGLTWRDLRELE